MAIDIPNLNQEDDVDRCLICNKPLDINPKFRHIINGRVITNGTIIRLTEKRVKPKKFAHTECLTEADLKFYQERNKTKGKKVNINGTSRKRTV